MLSSARNLTATAAAGLLIAVTTALNPDDVPVLRIRGKVDSVTVFSDRALVRRRHEFKFDSGTQRVRIADLPATILPDSVRASMDSGTIASVSLRHVSPEAEANRRDPALAKKIKKLEQEIRTEKDSVGSFQEQIKLLNSFGKLATAQTDNEARKNTIKVDSWGDALRFMEEKRRDYNEKIRRTEQKLEELQKELKAMNDQAGRMRMGDRHAPIEIDITCTGKPGDPGRITLEYITSGVSWQGIYDLHGSAEGGDFRLESRAAVKQSTGEDWNDVQISLSSARPAAGMAPGALRTWRVTQSGFSPVDTGKSRDKSDEENSRGGRGGDAVDTSDAQDSSTFSVQIVGRDSIPSDNSEHRIVISRTAMKGTITHVAVPALSGSVFLRTRMRNTSGMPLLWGTMNVFLDGGFTGSAALAYKAAVNEEFDMYLGADQRLQVKRTLLRGDIAASGILSKKVEIENQWEIAVSNFTKKTREVIVLDQFPVTGDPSIATKFLGSSRPDVKSDANGLLTWNLTVPAGKSEKLNFSYSIEIPREMWERLEQTMKERERTPNQNQLEDPSPSKPKRMYNLEKMFIK